MLSSSEPEIILYDLACIENVCFSPTAWRIRLLLNYKRIPYRTVFLEFPDIESTLGQLQPDLPVASAHASPKFTVPTIYHIPSNQSVMDSLNIARFIEQTYPQYPVVLSSDLGNAIESQARRALAPIFRTSIMSREVGILSGPASVYFVTTRQAALGFPLKDLLEGNKEEECWDEAKDKLYAVDKILAGTMSGQRFLFGNQPSFTDFTIAGALQSARVVHEVTFRRILLHQGFQQVYDSCQPLMEHCA